MLNDITADDEPTGDHRCECCGEVAELEYHVEVFGWVTRCCVADFITTKKESEISYE